MATTRLQRFRLDGIRDTGIDIGRGSYAVVKELNFRGLKCVGKEIHSLLYEEAAPGRERADMLRRFEEECELLGRLHHPNIVQFLGVHVGTSSGLPALVMEYLPATLSGCVDRHGVLPAEISLSILRDVALGIRYLHEYSPPIIHRDLSANNVLLTTSLSAKISDLGVAKIMDMSPARAARMTQTQVPGTPSYMPPETMVARPKYTSKVDIFSMGVLMVHVLSGEWPIPSEAFTDDPLDPNKVVLVMEFDRRHDTINKIETGHPLLGLIRQCLNNIPTHRPDAKEIAHHMRECTSPENRLELLGLVQENEALRREIEVLQTTKTQENDTLRREYEAMLTGERRQKDLAISSLTTEIERMRSELALMQEISRSDKLKAEVQRLPIHERADSPTGTSPHARLQWKRGADALDWIGEAQAVVMGERVCVDSGHTVCQYDWTRDTWSTLPDCPVRRFGMVQFLGKLITVGGRDSEGSVTGKIYQFNEQVQKWSEFLTPVPTARSDLTVITRSRAIDSSSPLSADIAACGGCDTRDQVVNTVEVYSLVSPLWHTVKSLPVPCYGMTSVTINDTCYLLGGRDSYHHVTKYCFSVSLDSLIDSGFSESDDPVWMTVSDTPLTRSTASSLRNSLIAIGGEDASTNIHSAAIHFLTSDGSWERVREGDLPEPCYGSAAVCLPSSELLVAGGYQNSGIVIRLMKTVFIASIV